MHEDPRHHLTDRGGEVDALANGLEDDAPLAQVGHGGQYVRHAAPEPVQGDHGDRVALAGVVRQGGQAGAVVAVPHILSEKIRSGPTPAAIRAAVCWSRLWRWVLTRM